MPWLPKRALQSVTMSVSNISEHESERIGREIERKLMGSSVHGSPIPSWFVDYGLFPGHDGKVIVFIGRYKATKRALTSDNPDWWYGELANWVAARNEAEFVVNLDRKGNFIYDAFSWPISVAGGEIKKARLVMAELSRGIKAAQKIDAVELVRTAKLTAAIKSIERFSEIQ